MVARQLRPSGSFACAVLLALSAACGARSERQEDAGTGGTSSGGAGASGGAGGSGASGASSASGGSSGKGPGCWVDGVFHELDVSFPAGDGCNTCVCRASGEIVCTRTACTDCADLPRRYQDALVEAKRCEPGLRLEQCTMVAASGLRCGCPTYVNDDSALLPLSEEFQEGACFGPVSCGACPDEPLGGVCAADGFCEDSYTEPTP